MPFTPYQPNSKTTGGTSGFVPYVPGSSPVPKVPQPEQQQPSGGLLKNTILGLPSATGIGQMFMSGIDQVKQGIQQFKTPGIINKGEGLLNIGGGIANSAFSPLAPVLNLENKAIDYASNKVTDIPVVQKGALKLPDLPYDRLAQAVGNIGAIAGLGSAVGGLVKGRIQATTDTIKEPVKISIPAETPAELPLKIKAISEAIPEKPTPAFIPYKASKTAPETTIVPKLNNVDMANKVVGEIAKPIEIKTDVKLNSRVFERMKVEHPQLEGALGYDPIKLKVDAEKAVSLIAKDKQKAYDIAMGKETSTEMTSTGVNIALAEKALQEGNHALYAKLIKNRSLEQTRRGQEISAERGSVTDNSTSRYVKDLIASRLEKLGDSYLGNLKDNLRKKTSKTKATQVIDAEVAKLEKTIKAKKLTVKDALSLLDELACV